MDKFDLRETFELEMLESILHPSKKSDSEALQRFLVEICVDAVNKYFALDKDVHWIGEVFVLDMRDVVRGSSSRAEPLWIQASKPANVKIPKAFASLDGSADPEDPHKFSIEPKSHRHPRSVFLLQSSLERLPSCAGSTSPVRYLALTDHMTVNSYFRRENLKALLSQDGDIVPSREIQQVRTSERISQQLRLEIVQGQRENLAL